MFAQWLLIGMTIAQGQPTEELVFADPLANLGELRSYVAYKHAFAFGNQGRETIEVLGVEPSCGCIVAKFERQAIRPGDTGTLPIEVKPTSQPEGPHSWFAKVRYRSGTVEREARLQMKATIRQEVSVQPTSLILYGLKGVEHEIKITDRREKPLNIVRLHSSTGFVDVQVSCSPIKGQRRLLFYAKAYPPGRHDDLLTVFTDDPLYPEIKIPLTFLGVRNSISALPERIKLRRETGKPLPSTLVRLRPPGNTKLAIQEVKADDPAITCTFAPGPGDGATVRVQVDAAQLKDRDLRASVRVVLQSPAGESVIIPVQALRE